MRDISLISCLTFNSDIAAKRLLFALIWTSQQQNLGKIDKTNLGLKWGKKHIFAPDQGHNVSNLVLKIEKVKLETESSGFNLEPLLRLFEQTYF